jgi:hypothetical protein
MAIIRASPIKRDAITRVCICGFGRYQSVRTTGEGRIGGAIVRIWAADFPNDAWTVVLERVVAIVLLSVDRGDAQETVCRDARASGADCNNEEWERRCPHGG